MWVYKSVRPLKRNHPDVVLEKNGNDVPDDVYDNK